MKILGLNIGHTATACLLIDGEVVACLSEERISRKKNQAGVPIRAINTILADSLINIKDIDAVIVDNAYAVNNDTDFVRCFISSHKNPSIKRQILLAVNRYFPSLYRIYFIVVTRFRKNNWRKKIVRNLSLALGVECVKISVIDHHVAHAYAASFNIEPEKRTLVFTMDGEGAGVSASVGIFLNNCLKNISYTKKNASLGYLYSLVTMLLGMRPLQDEFKVMGLAAYAKKGSYEHIYKKLDSMIGVSNDLTFFSNKDISLAENELKEILRYERFDNVAGALQTLLEDKVLFWVRAGIKKTGIKDLVLAGGVFMNIKLVMKISALKEVNTVYVVPSAGDESNAIGSACWGYLNLSPTVSKISPISNLYLGLDYNSEIDVFLEKNNIHKKYHTKKCLDINSVVAELLAQGEVVARFSGRNEWGARGLGNRSILANPTTLDQQTTINKLIKNRDFWMPFAPSILSEFSDKYIVDNGKILSKAYMVSAFELTSLGKKVLRSAMHSYDETTRPHIISQKENFLYHDLVKKFYNITGVGAILNTSFNLHGKPNVLRPTDAIQVFEKSGLKYLSMGNYIIKK